MTNSPKPQKKKIIEFPHMTKKELAALDQIISYSLTSAIEDSSGGINGGPEEVEYHKKNPQHISALEKMDKFLRSIL